MEPSYLELRGAIDLLRAALKTIPTSGWQGATYYNAKPAETQAYCVISRCITDCYRELNAWNSKIVKAGVRAINCRASGNRIARYELSCILSG